MDEWYEVDAPGDEYDRKTGWLLGRSDKNPGLYMVRFSDSAVREYSPMQLRAVIKVRAW